MEPGRRNEIVICYGIRQRLSPEVLLYGGLVGWFNWVIIPRIAQQRLFKTSTCMRKRVHRIISVYITRILFCQFDILMHILSGYPSVRAYA